MAKIEIEVIQEMFSFSSEQDWVNRAQRAYGAIPDYKRSSFITVDSIGRVCTRGEHFRIAKEQNTYPVTCYQVAT